MKKILIIFLIICCQSCLVQYKMPISTLNYLTIREIKEEYSLSNKECRLIIDAAENDEIDCKYNYILQCWTYDYKIDYNLFKLARK